MKYTLIFLWLFAGTVKGQTLTIPVIMQVSDTATHKIKHYAGEVVGSTGEQTITLAEDYTEYFIDSTVWWIRGYEVLKKSDQNNYLANAAIVSIWNPAHPGYEHLKYLDANKKPIKFFVWLSKELTP